MSSKLQIFQRLSCESYLVNTELNLRPVVVLHTVPHTYQNLENFLLLISPCYTNWPFIQ